MKTFWKGLIMAIVGFVAATITDLETMNWSYIGVTTVAFTLMYLGKNYWKPSTSEPGTVNTSDLISGLLVALGMAVSSFSASIITLGFIDWRALIISSIGAVVGYFAKTAPAKPKT